MEAALITGQRRVELVEVPEPVAGDGQAVVAIDRCGICGTDVSAYKSGRPYTPFLHGHEWTGVVTSLGPGTTTVDEGDRVVLGAKPPCGTCAHCRAGHVAHCEGVLSIALPVPQHGGYAPRINVETVRLHRVPDSMSVEIAAMIDPATVALHGVRRTQIRTDDLVVVTGAGPIGLIALQLAGLAGAEVLVIEPNERRRGVAASLGAATVASADEAAELVRRGRPGADVVLECSGSDAAITAGVGLLRTGGQLTMIGVSSSPITIDPNLWLVREVTVRTALAHTMWEFDTVFRLLAEDRLQLGPLHDTTVSLAELPAAFESLAAGSAGPIKVLVDPTA